jgi:hypothetical protein
MARFIYAQFTDFLKNIDLEAYRNKYTKVKTVEMDLRKEIQALATIYEQYWQNKDGEKTPLTFEDYYKIYYATNKTDIEKFWHSTGFGKNCKCFNKGLEARIYRTWASLITQIHAGYVAESVFGKGTVKMGTEIDRKEIDILVVQKQRAELKIQIKKVTHRPEFARRQENQKSEDVNVKEVFYIVPNPNDYLDTPYYKVNRKHPKPNELEPSLKDFVKFNPNGTLDRLDNGFVVFTKTAFKIY